MEIANDFAPVDKLELGIGGVCGDVYLINYKDWLNATITRGADKEITAIALNGTGARAYKYELTRGGVTPSSPFTDNAGGKSGYTHSLLMFLNTKISTLKKDIAGLGNFGRVVAIPVLDDSKVVANVYGSDVGLKLTGYEENPNDPAKGGGIDVTLSTPTDTTVENLPPVQFFDTDRATTIAALEALLTAV